LPSRRPMHVLPCNFMLSGVFQREPGPDLIRGDYQFAPENPHKKHACRLAEFQTRFQTPKLLEFTHLKPIWLRSKLAWIQITLDQVT
jgi:hypothetical protein